MLLILCPWLWPWPFDPLSLVYPPPKPAEPSRSGNVIDLGAEKRRRAARPARRL